MPLIRLTGGRLAAGLLALGLSGAAAPALAALQSGEFQSGALTRFMPRSPVISRIQVLLQEFDLYDGPIDGRLNDELIAAVKRYQAISGLKPDGRVSEELLAHIEFKGQAERLLARLLDASKTQRELARKQLRQSAATRGLVDRVGRKDVADPTRDPTLCYDAPTVVCLITEAIETAKSVHRRHFRDWVYGEIAIVQARARMPEAARQSAGSIEDPRLIIKTLRNIAQAQAETDQLAAAAVSAGIVPDEWSRLEALAALAGAQARAGDWPAARQMTADIQRLLEDIVEERPKTALLGRLARGLSAAGDAAAALSILELESERLRRAGVNAAAQLYTMSTLSTAYSNLDLAQRGRAHLPGKKHAVQRRTALIALARAEARGDRDDAAAQVASELGEAQYRAVAFADIGAIQMAAGRRAAARLSLDKARTSVGKIDPARKYSLAHAIDRISSAWLQGGLLLESEQAAIKIDDAKLRAFAFARIAQSYFGGNEMAQAERLSGRMEAAAADINGALDRVWMYANVSLYQAARGNLAGASAMFTRGLDVVRTMSSSWARAQALVRLVSALGGLTKSGISPTGQK